MDILISSTPAHLRITQTMLGDFIMDPVTAFRWLMGIEPDAFQRYQLRMLWWVPECIVENGVSTGKTNICSFGIANMRACLLPHLGKAEDVGVYHYTFEQGKNTFWNYYTTLAAPMLRAQLGDWDDPNSSDKDAKRRGSSCWKASYKSGGAVYMPAPDVRGDAANQAGYRFNSLVIDEWTKWDASGEAINTEILDRRSKESFNANHPIWANHTVFLGHAETRGHPSTKRFETFSKRIAAGDAGCAILTASYKDYSSLPNRRGSTFREANRTPAEANARTQRANLGEAEFLAKYLGIRSEGGKGWYTEQALLGAVELGRMRRLRPMSSARDQGPA